MVSLKKNWMQKKPFYAFFKIPIGFKWYTFMKLWGLKWQNSLWAEGVISICEGREEASFWCSSVGAGEMRERSRQWIILFSSTLSNQEKTHSKRNFFISSRWDYFITHRLLRRAWIENKKQKRDIFELW